MSERKADCLLISAVYIDGQLNLANSQPELADSVNFTGNYQNMQMLFGDDMEATKKKPHVAFNSGNNEWYTPKEIINAACEVMGEIDLDPASSELANETVCAKKFYTIDSDGLTKDWYGRIWLNPPYARGMVEKFIDKLIGSKFEQAIVLVNNATDTKWFSRLAETAKVIVFPKGRVKFNKPDGSTGSPLQGQAIVYIGDNGVKFREVFGKFGWVAKI